MPEQLNSRKPSKEQKKNGKYHWENNYTYPKASLILTSFLPYFFATFLANSVFFVSH